MKYKLKRLTTLLSHPPIQRGLVVATLAAACMASSPQAHANCVQLCLGTTTAYGDAAGAVGADSTAVGFMALNANTANGIQNTALGSLALVSNTDGYNNTAVGKTALQSNTTAIDGTAVGVAALQLNTTGNFNVGVGLSALTQNTTGTLNTAVGTSALYYNVNGNSNTATGANALQNVTGTGNVGIGNGAGVNLTAGNNNIDIGNAGVAAESDTTRIGASQTRVFVAGLARIVGKTVVWNASTQQLGLSGGSSKRFKEAIKPMDKTSQSILALHPVSFRYKKEIDPDKTPQFGLVAEEVEKVDPELVTRDPQGKPDGVRYDAVNSMLLNEFLKEHQKVAEQGETIGQLKSITANQQKEIKALTADLKAQAGQIQKVSAQVAAEKPAARLVSVDR